MPQSSFARSRFLRHALAIPQSVLLHILVVVVIWFGLPYTKQERSISQPVLTVDIVPTLDVTELNEGTPDAFTDREPAPEVKETAPPAPPPPPRPRTSDAPIDEIIPTPQETPVEQLPSPDAIAQQEAPPLPSAPEAQRDDETTDGADKKTFETYREETQQQLTTALQDILNDDSGKQNPDDEDTKPEEEEKKTELENLLGQALNATPRTRKNVLGVSVADKLRNHISKYWNPPIGAAGADSLTVTVVIYLGEEGKVTRTEIQDKSRFGRDAAFKAAAQAAARAVSEASPLPLTEDDYKLLSGDEEKPLEYINFVFDPCFITRRCA